MNRNILIMIILGVALVMLGIVYALYDFYNDFRCSVTDDMEWYIKNDCMKYYKGE